MLRLKELRQAKKIKQSELAKKLGIAQNTLSCWESGKTEPDIASLIRLSELFGVDLNYLLGLANDPTPFKEKTLKEAIESTVELNEESKADLKKYMDLLKMRERGGVIETSPGFSFNPVEG